MARNGALTTKQKGFVACLMSSGSVRSAAQLAGIAERTGWRYLSNDGVRAAIRERQDALLAHVTTGIISDMAKARAVLLSVMADGGVAPGVRIRAGGLVLNAGLRLFEILSLSERVAALERLFAEREVRK